MALAAPPTLLAFLQLSYIDDAPAWEFNNGELAQKIMGGGQHSTLQKRLVSHIDLASSDYEAFPELRCSFGNRSLVPDIVVLPTEHIPLDETGEIISTGLDFSPTWAIGILSPKQSQTKVTDNLLHCLRHGCQLGWLVDPQTRSVLIYWPNGLPEICRGRDRLPALAGIEWQVPVEELFGWLRR